MDWQPGDLALCVNAGLGCPACGHTRGKKGKLYTVSEVGERMFIEGIRQYLFLREAPNEHRCGGGGWTFGHRPQRFIKVTPPEADAFDREVIAALNSEPVHARNNDAVHNSCQREVENAPRRHTMDSVR